jgi:hypothetical protein
LPEAIETKMDSADLYSDTSKRSILIVGSPALALGLQFSIYAEAATTEQPIVAKTVSGQGLAVRIDGRNATTDAGWPAQFSCVVPTIDTEFTARTRPGP